MSPDLAVVSMPALSGPVGEIVGQITAGRPPRELAVMPPDEALPLAAALVRGGDARGLPVLLTLIWAQSKAEDDARLWQAEALYLLYHSGLWRPWADVVDMGGGRQVPSWKSFVTKHLPLKYTTAEGRMLAFETYGMRLGWGHDEIRRVGLSKCQTARALVEDEITRVGPDGTVTSDASRLSPQTAQMLREGTASEVAEYVARQRGRRGEIGGTFSYNPDSGLLVLWVDELSYVIGRLNTTPPDGMDNGWWQRQIGRVVRALKVKKKGDEA